MGKTHYTSVYIPIDLKIQLVETAEAEGYAIGQGRQSQLVKFIASLLQERQLFAKNNPKSFSFYSLNPDLRSSVFRLNELDESQQQHVGSVLKVLLEAFSSSNH